MSLLKRKRRDAFGKSKKMPQESLDEEPDDDLNPEAFANSMSNLKDTDPEFYAFLEENDRKLLDFKVDSDQSGDDENETQSQDEEDELHKPDGELQNDSDDSDFEDEGGESMPNKLTLKIVAEWQKSLQSEGKTDLSVISNLIKAFHSALLRVSGTNNDDIDDFKVEGSGVFNSVIQTCVLYLQPALKKILRMKGTDKQPQKCKRWIKVKGLIKTYFIDLFKLLGGITSTNILNILLKHLHQMSVFLACFPSLSKVLFKRLTHLWSSSEETVRVLAFICILRVTRNNQPLLLDGILKMMYMSYVKNCKFVSPTTRPGISFMRRSLVEMFALDVNVSYQHVFLYIRQLAIHLRNAIILHKKENIQIVYNWQFINSLQLWADLLSATRAKPQLQSLIYPLVMIITNTIKLNPTAQYYPLRFHCVQILINISRESEVFIPILPFLLEILTTYNFDKKHKKVSMKPQNFSCVLRLSKSHLSENGFKDAVIENIHSLLLETLCIYSHTISFPDMVVPCVLQLKQFLKSCTVANYCRKIRSVLEKIEENTQFIERARKNVSFHLKDVKLIKAWETNIQNAGTPLQTYYDSWKKINMRQDKNRATKNHDMADRLPKLLKLNKSNKIKDQGPTELFPSDSEDDDMMLGLDDEENEITPPLKKKKKGKKESALDENISENVDGDSKKIKKKKTKKVSSINTVEDGDKEDELKEFNIVDW